MRAWAVGRPGPLAAQPLRWIQRERPMPAAGEVLVRVRVCGVCRTDLHLAEGDLPPRRPDTIPGHEVVGEVVECGPAAHRFAPGDRIGIAWLRHTCGSCRWCRSGRENLCEQSRYTGWDDDGGYAEFAVVPEGFAYRLPAVFTDEQAAPLLCAGIIGYRSLLRARVPAGGTLGIYGFGASAHLTAQVAIAQGAEVHVLTRGEGARDLARELGAASVGGPRDAPPVPLDSAIIFAPAGDLVPLALEALDAGGTLALAGIHMSDVPRARLPAAPVPRADPLLGHEQHPPRRGGVPRAGGAAGPEAQHHGIPAGARRRGAGTRGRRRCPRSRRPARRP